MSNYKPKKCRAKLIYQSEPNIDAPIHCSYTKTKVALDHQPVIGGCNAKSKLTRCDSYLSESVKLTRRLLILCMLVLLPVQVSFAQELMLWLQNDEGIFQDPDGAVTRWENQVESNGDATQSISALGGEAFQETYPGKVNVGFNGNRAFLALDDSSSYFSDSSFSVFYTGSVADVGDIASLIGNMRAESSDFSVYSGIRFVRTPDDDLVLQYASPGFKQVLLKNLPDDGFFFFGFTMNASGDYRYFDNTADDVITGNIGGVITHSERDFNLNLLLTHSGAATFDHTEVAEVMVFDDYMSEAQFQALRERFSSEYPEIVEKNFEIVEITPANRLEILPSDPITITFSSQIGTPVEAYPQVFVNKSSTEAPGTWSLTGPGTLTFNSQENWPYGALVKVVMDPLLDSSLGDRIEGRDYNFIVETQENYGVQINNIASIGTVNEGQHNLPMDLVLPITRDERIPVHFWVHGGGWGGGTPQESESDMGPHAVYLAEHLGIATLGLAYRTEGSNGNFTLAMQDIDLAVQWAEANADVYNFDMTKMIFSGGSAGSPLASLAAQRYSGSKAFVGFNGIYNFQEDDRSRFGPGNDYGQETPSATANSAIYQLRENPPATLVLHGTADTTIDISQSLLFAEAVVNAGSPGIAVQYEDEPHAFFNIGREEYEDVMYEMVEFLKGLGLTQNGGISAPRSPLPPQGFVEIRNESLDGWLESTTLPDPTNSTKREVRLNPNGAASSRWLFTESSEEGWYHIFTESGEYLQMSNVADIQNNVVGLALRTSDIGGGSWTRWKLVESSEVGEFHIINQAHEQYVSTTREAQDANLLAYFVHGIPTTSNGSWTRWKLVE